MSDYISREAVLAEQRHLYCENCARRKGMKNGKMKFVYLPYSHLLCGAGKRSERRPQTPMHTKTQA